MLLVFLFLILGPIPSPLFLLLLIDIYLPLTLLPTRPPPPVVRLADHFPVTSWRGSGQQASEDLKGVGVWWVTPLLFATYLVYRIQHYLKHSV